MSSLPPGPQSAPAPSGPEVLAPSVWRERQAAHLSRVRRWTGPQRERAARGQKHPVYDFLWEYYAYRPAQLERWHPGLGVVLAGPEAQEFLAHSGYAAVAGGVAVSIIALAPHRLDSVRWIAHLLRACQDRPPFFGCFGLHEWAMVYRTDTVRHTGLPLRFPTADMDRIVESQTVRCSHFDAFRFFAAAARPLNRLQPSRDTRVALEQRGCVHVTMDLYKWAAKLAPFVPAELTADAFELALAARELDMRASPYDLRDLGFEPVCIETPAGRADYEREQRVLAERAIPVRSRLLSACERILTAAAAHAG